MSKKNCDRRFGSEAEAFRRRQIVQDAKYRIIKKAEALVSRKQNSGGRFFVVENGRGRHPNQ